MTEKVHGYYYGGEFLTGDLDFVSVYTTVAIDATGVVSPLNEFKDLHFLDQAVNISTLPAASRTLNGVVYADDAAYTAAYWAQKNFNNLTEQASRMASPVILTRPVASPVRAVAGDPVNDFEGNAIVNLAGTDAVYGFIMAVEHASAFAGDAGSKTVGAADQVKQLNEAYANTELRDATGTAVTVNVAANGNLFAVVTNNALVGGAV